MVGLEHGEAVRELRLGGLEDREIVQVLDLVMGVELLQEELQARRKPGAEVLRGGRPLAKRRGGVGQRARDLAEHVVPLQPELRHAAEIGVALPHLARIAVGEQAQLGRPAGARIEREGEARFS